MANIFQVTKNANKSFSRGNNSGWNNQGDLFGLAGQEYFLDDLELGLFSEIIKI